MDEKTYEYVTANIVLGVNESQDSDKVTIPAGRVIAIGAIVAGNTGSRIINLSILQNNQEIIRPADVRFTQKTSGGTFKNSLRPVDFEGGRTFEAKVVATAASATEEVAIQVLFMIEKAQTY
jgi:hypothetical protein